ncbi:MAG: hypothetical protein ACK57B_07395 [Betaproteobacteria bacterium]|jgi:hypothetical protein
MRHSQQEFDSLGDAAARAAALERPLEAVEQQLQALGTALHRQDAVAVDAAAAELHVALAAAVDHFTLAASQGTVPAPLRRRLAQAGGQVAAQREALARATASLDRAIEVLIPRSAPATLYSPQGSSTSIGSDRVGSALVA